MRAVLLDLDDTLYSYPPCHEAGLARAFAALGGPLDLDEEGFRALYEEARSGWFTHLGDVAASHSRELYFKAIVERARGRADVALSREGDRAYWEGYHEVMHPFPGMRELLDGLRARGMALGLVTNLTVGVQLEKLVRLGAHEDFDVIVTSEEAGADKPDPRPFRRALAALGVEPEEACMIGDDLARDVEGAHAVGIPAIWLRLGRPRAELPPGCRSVEGLRSLLKAPWAEVFPAGFPDEGAA